jgi:hypothetical protein
VHDGDPSPSCTLPASANSVWYRYSPTRDGTITISTAGSTYDTAFAVYVGGCADPFQPDLFEVACAPGEPGQPAELSFRGEDLKTYFIMVTDRREGGGGGGGTLQFELSLGSQPPIVVDGDPSDWADIAPLLLDPPGDLLPPLDQDPGRDILEVSITNDDTRVYFLVRFAGDPTAPEHLILLLGLDTDRNASTGCPLFGLNGIEYEFVLIPRSQVGAVASLTDARDCDPHGPDFLGSIATGGFFIEASIDIDALRTLTPTMTGFNVFASSGADLPSQTGLYVLH